MQSFIYIRSIAKIIVLLLLSWILIHLFSIFGIFLAISLYTLWFISPKFVPCVGCKIFYKRKVCPFCNSQINLKDGYAKNFKSVLITSFAVFIFSAISILFVAGEAYLLKSSGLIIREKTASFAIPNKRQYIQGDIFNFKIELKDLNEPINTVQADISFDPNLLEVVDVSTAESFATIFVQKEIDNKQGYIRLTGGIPNPGFFEKSAIFSSIIFKAKSPGVAEVNFLPSSMVLANDGKGTNILKDLASASYLILSGKSSGDTSQKSASFNVLGESTRTDQIIFFEDSKVLGDETSLDQTQEAQKNKGFIDFLNTVDEYIVKFWTGAFKSVKTSALEFNFEKAREDYIFTEDVYKKDLFDFNLKKASYQKNPTLSLKEELRSSLYKFIISRDNLIKSYLTTIRMKVLESAGINNDTKTQIYSEIDPEVLWFEDRKNNYSNNTSLEDLLNKSKEEDSRFTTDTLPAINFTLAHLNLGEVRSIKKQHNDIYQALRDEANELIKLGRADPSLFDRWFKDIDNELNNVSSIEQKTILEIDNILNSDPYKRQGGYKKATEAIELSKPALLKLNNFIKELESVVANKR